VSDCISDIEIGDIVLATYPNGYKGTARVLSVTGRTINLVNNWGKPDWKFSVPINNGKSQHIELLTRKEWNKKENIS